MKIYTRTGDSGTTGLFGGARVDKDSQRVEAYGSVDELNACLGAARSIAGPGELGSVLEAIQSDLFTLGAELGCVPGKEARLGMRLVGTEDTARLEGLIDGAEAKLDPLKTFILPGGSALAASLHVARTVCRRAERRVIAARHAEPVRDEVVHYLNRLSDLLFVLAREANRHAGVSDTPWSGRK
ncbi:MAG TPA: cob(I)yrinic acid a,c-diamide adenosyltransferase [Polyangiaceae bacterium]|nr:cob(I)yrinic acid a,c-diamide adenosyltransferase [Polyangiaceae bacterium]